MRILTCLGDANSIHTHGGLPFFLLEAGRRAGFLDRGLTLRPSEMRWRRLGWNALRLLTTGERGGYQYTEGFLERMVAQAGAEIDTAEIVSIYPLFPPAEHCHGRLSIYVDATLSQSIGTYAMGAKLPVGPRMFEAAMERERRQYEAARRIVCRSRWAARELVERYAIDPGKVYVVPGGANLPDVDDRLRTLPAGALAPLRLGFIGKDWKRKNLPFLLEVADILYARGLAVEVVAAGFDPASGPRHPRLNAIGFLNKQRELGRFIEVVSSLHFGCLFSVAEAFGISNRECLRLGVPVLARDVGGIADTIPDGLGHLFPHDAGPVDVADVLQAYVKEPDIYWALRARVMARRRETTWDCAVAKLIAVWEGSHEDAYMQLLWSRPQTA